MDSPVKIYIEADGIIIVVNDPQMGKGRSPLLGIGDRWVIGAVDKELYPYEVSIVVVNRLPKDSNDR
jgi:hypothetical protein